MVKKLPVGKVQHQCLGKVIVPGQIPCEFVTWQVGRAGKTAYIDGQDAENGEPAHNVENVDSVRYINRL